METFRDRFLFNRSKALFVGVERECFLTDRNGKIQPLAEIVLKKLYSKHRFGYELSACQLESRSGPSKLSDIKSELMQNEALITEAERELNFRRLHVEVGPLDMPLDVFPDPSGRYARITKDMPRETLLSACRIIGTHVHIGMPDHETALHTYNRLIDFFPLLCEKGNGSFGERLAIYRIMAPRYEPKKYANWKAFYENAKEFGFADDPKRCWTLIRISTHGTIEFRMFGATSSIDRVVEWASFCHELCAKSMK